VRLRGSLAARLLGVELLVIGVLLVVAPLIASALLRHTIDSYQRQLLAGQARQVEAGLRFDGGRFRLALPMPLQAVFTAGFEGRAYALVDAAGNRLMQSPGSAPLSSPIPRGRTEVLFHAGRFVGLSRPAGPAPGRLWIVVSQDETDAGAVLDDIGRALLPRTVILIFVTLAMLPMVNAVILRELGRRVAEVANSAEAIGPAHPGLRLEETRLPREVASLARATNRLVSRLEKGIAEHRAFIANVTHELKTPLARLSMQIDSLDEPHRQRLRQGIEQMSRVISQVRALGELETLEDIGWASFDLAAVARGLAEALAPQVYDAGATLELSTPDRPVMVTGNPVLIELAMRNLLDNARQHTPTGTAILLTVTAEGLVAVSDTGPGIAVEARDELRRRFHRADHSRTDTAGLGLSIVDRICEVHRTVLEISGDTGGARFSFALPRAADARTPG
jgi:signal transduction histidine kinase